MAKSLSNSPNYRMAALLDLCCTRFGRKMRRFKESNWLSSERFSTLSMIERRGPIGVSVLASREMVRPASMSRMVSILVDDGLAKRIDDKTDGRGVFVVATPKGRRASQRTREARIRGLEMSLGRLTTDQLRTLDKLAQLLQTLTATLDGQQRTWAGPAKANRSVEGAQIPGGDAKKV